MLATFKIDEPDKLTASVVLTTTLTEWRKLSEQLQGKGWPACKLQEILDRVINHANDVFNTQSNSEPPH